MNQKSPTTLSAKDLRGWLENKSSQPCLIDVREEGELEIASLPVDVLHLPLSNASNWIKTLPDILPKDQPLVVICHLGIRSWNFGSWLLEQGWGYEVWNLSGGIDAWSTDVDPTIPRY